MQWLDVVIHVRVALSNNDVLHLRSRNYMQYNLADIYTPSEFLTIFSELTSELYSLSFELPSSFLQTHQNSALMLGYCWVMNGYFVFQPFLIYMWPVVAEAD